MKIGFDAKRAFNNGTGLGNYSRFVIRAFMQQHPEHEYFLFTPRIKSEYAKFYHNNDRVHIVTPEGLWKLAPSLWRVNAWTNLCAKLNLDVFHGLSNELPDGIQSFKGKKIVTIHDLIFMRYPSYYSAIDRFIYTRKVKAACEAADLIVAASAQTRDDIVRYFNTPASKIEVVYQDCDPIFSSASSLPKSAPTEPYVLCVGTIEQRKNQLTVLKAFHELNAPGLQLHFVGRATDYKNTLDQYVNEHQLSDRVKFLHGVSHDELPGLYRSAKMFVYASEFEGFGIPVLEALRSAVPVICARSSSLPEVGGDAALYFDPANAAELAGHMRVLLSDEAKRRKMVEAGTAQATKFDAPELMRQLDRIYPS